METEPLVKTNAQMNNYNSDDGSSILNPHQTTVPEPGDPTARHITIDKPEPDKSSHTVLERFHEDALQQVRHFSYTIFIYLLFSAISLLVVIFTCIVSCFLDFLLLFLSLTFCCFLFLSICSVPVFSH
jgi:hypothetical protein